MNWGITYRTAQTGIRRNTQDLRNLMKIVNKTKPSYRNKPENSKCIDKRHAFYTLSNKFFDSQSACYLAGYICFHTKSKLELRVHKAHKFANLFFELLGKQALSLQWHLRLARTEILQHLAQHKNEQQFQPAAIKG